MKNWQGYMSERINILFLWKPEDTLWNYLKDGLKDFPIIEFFIVDKEIQPEIEKEYYVKSDIIIGWRPNEEYIREAKNLKLFINPGAGVKHLMKLFKELNSERKITLVNGHGNSYFTAQHGVALLLSLMNKIVPHHNWMKVGRWRLGDDEAKTIPLRDRRIGLLGYGAINKKIHKFLSGFDVEFHVLKRSWNENNETGNLKKYLPEHLHEFLTAVDILIIALPDTDKTNNLIDTKELELFGKNKNAVLVNIARGAIINEEALYNALKNNVIVGAAMDVWYNYSPEAIDDKKYPYDSEKFPFHELENVILSPHRAASPHDDLKRWDEVIENISRFAKGEQKFLNTVDIEKGY
ncbi:MAG: hypothetical protein JST55_08605 [Bacteroidetes bacterium]|nr:hypothetical protein [Bacteroidota bacterium]